MGAPRKSIVLLMLPLAVLAVACSGDGGSAPTRTPDPNTRDLASIAGEFAAASFRGEYTLKGGPDSDLGSGTLVIYKGGSDRLRFDVSGEQDGEVTEIILIQTSSTSAFCLKNAGEFGALLGIPEGGGVCFNDDPAGADDETGDYSDLIAQLESGQGEITGRSQRQIAGMAADCYQVHGTGGDDSEVCFSADGYLLSTTEEDGSGFEATSVSGSVADADFDLPYQVSELPDLGE